jgi:thiol-disulfide isomerase/thioredoxin
MNRSFLSLVLMSGLTLGACTGGGDAGAGGSDGGSSADGGTVGCDKTTYATCPGNASPAWVLEDKLPTSTRVGQSYGPEAFRGQVLVVALVAGWCPYCQKQIPKFAAIQKELRAKGVQITIVGINKDDDRKQEINNLFNTDVLIFQDKKSANGRTPDTAYQLLLGEKDDIYIYNASGVLTKYFNGNNGPSTNLTTYEGERNIRDAIDAASKSK